MMRQLVSRCAAAVLTLAALGACDAAVTIPETQFEGVARRHEAPMITLTNNNGFPQLSWNALPGAIDYTVQLITHVDLAYGWFVTVYDYETYLDETVTTATSMIDYSRFYSGQVWCASNQDPYNYIYWYEYQVVARFSDGTTQLGKMTSPAPVADYFCRRW